ncbi:MAG: NAD-dependent epimerase/dehydratase family protein [Chloroflexota bacterium]
MKILITGNMGYIGPDVTARLRESYPGAVLVGYDTGFFAQHLTNAEIFPECRVDVQHFGDVREFPPVLLEGINAVVHLAAVSNDPIGNRFEEVTLAVNHRASVEIARQAKEAGVSSFVFASSCSVYGFAEEGARTERSTVNPLTAYAKSKVFTERDLGELADRNFKVTSLRFATACGMSPRLRLDLVLNDFVAGAIASRRITILSDGTPWRPLINVKDMASAIGWAVARDAASGGDFLVVNAGSNEWNYQVRDLAAAVARVIPGVEVSINSDAQPDKRSYKVDFGLFRSLAPHAYPVYDIERTVADLRDGLLAMGFNDQDFRNSRFMRLKVLEGLRSRGLLDEQLHWTFRSPTVA